MTNPNVQNQGQEITQIPKTSIVSKITGGFSWWIRSLTGKPQPTKATPKPVIQAPPPAAQPVQPTTTTQQPSAQTSDVDPVTQDLTKLKTLLGKVTADISKNVTPVVSKGVAASSKKASAFGQSNQKFLRTVLKIFFILVLVMVVAFIGIKLLRQLPEGENGETTPTEEISTSPTPIVFTPTKPSVYADDPVTLKLEQDIDVLVREISGTNIKETQLNPPVLDFNVTF